MKLSNEGNAASIRVMAILSLVALLVGCSVEAKGTGDAGPPGQAGATGPTGPQGGAGVPCAGCVDSASIAQGAVGAAQIADGGVTASALAPGAVGAAALAGGSVGTAAFAPGAVDTNALGAGAVTSANLGAGVVGAAALAGGSVGTAAFALGAVDNALSAGAVTSAKLGAGAVTSAKIAAGAVGSAQIGSGAVTGANVAATTLAEGALNMQQVGVVSSTVDETVMARFLGDLNGLTTLRVMIVVNGGCCGAPGGRGGPEGGTGQLTVLCSGVTVYSVALEGPGGSPWTHISPSFTCAQSSSLVVNVRASVAGQPVVIRQLELLHGH